MDTIEGSLLGLVSLTAVTPVDHEECNALCSFQGEATVFTIPMKLTSEEIESISHNTYYATINLQAVVMEDDKPVDYDNILSFEAYVQRKRGNA